jgi:hypothetical protein
MNMEMTTETIINISKFVRQLTPLIYERLQQFSDRYGDAETENVFGTHYEPSAYDITFEYDEENTQICWITELSIGKEYGHFPAKFIDIHEWSKYLDCYQDTMKLKYSLEREEQINAVIKEIRDKEEELRVLRQNFDDLTAIKTTDLESEV